ncbi:MAG: class II fumarate hydratase [Natronospirillum sp.]|uniref:class II fumarate hydratase n=1 Tax=Natronospirillum sp. TaxID=2812955 RepID=UPI0025E27E67|nr:class II fumarate hydratase [Natronospirillum sp.]MCH8553161.1 class II fumarate hydratase [Natronospirillum sp.]
MTREDRMTRRPPRTAYRTEYDSLGPVDVPAAALYGAQTQRAVNHFNISGRPMPAFWLHTLARIKQAAALDNAALGELDPAKAEAIAEACQSIMDGEHLEQFPVDVFQTGSGTSSNMNMNEVVATLASQGGRLTVHPNDDVNRGQSSNDIVPSTNQLSAALAVRDQLLPMLDHLQQGLDDLSLRQGSLLKTGRTHLMDAMPLTVDQEIAGWQGVLTDLRQELDGLLPRLSRITLGGTAVGTGVNAHPRLGDRVAARLAAETGLPVSRTDNHFAAQSSQHDLLTLSGTLKNLATWLIKISNDLRWMNSGPLAGLSEARLPALQPGSSIMPGKVNPVIPEAVIQASAQVIGNDAAITLGAQNGQFQLNTAMPLVASNVLTSITLLTGSLRVLTDHALASFEYDEAALSAPLTRNPILATALNNEVGYNKAAEIAKAAYATGRPILDVALDMTELSEERLRELLDPARLT